MPDRSWQRRLDQQRYGSPPEPLILNEAQISQWLKDHRAEYTSAAETVKACMANFGLRRRHRKLVWNILSKAD